MVSTQYAIDVKLKREEVPSYSCSPDGIDRVDYFDTEHYRVIHDFVVNPKRMLDVLFADDVG